MQHSVHPSFAGHVHLNSIGCLQRKKNTTSYYHSLVVRLLPKFQYQHIRPLPDGVPAMAFKSVRKRQTGGLDGIAPTSVTSIPSHWTGAVKVTL